MKHRNGSLQVGGVLTPRLSEERLHSPLPVAGVGEGMGWGRGWGGGVGNAILKDGGEEGVSRAPGEGCGGARLPLGAEGRGQLRRTPDGLGGRGEGTKAWEVGMGLPGAGSRAGQRD